MYPNEIKTRLLTIADLVEMPVWLVLKDYYPPLNDQTRAALQEYTGLTVHEMMQRYAEISHGNIDHPLLDLPNWEFQTVNPFAVLEPLYT